METRQSLVIAASLILCIVMQAGCEEKDLGNSVGEAPSSGDGNRAAKEWDTTPRATIPTRAPMPTATTLDSTPTPSPAPTPTHFPTATYFGASSPETVVPATPTPSPTPDGADVLYGSPCIDPYREREALSFVHWSHDSSALVMDSGTSLVKVDNAGTEFQQLVNVQSVPSSASLLHGLYADVSPVDSRIAYVTCEYSHESIWVSEGSLRHVRRIGYELATMKADGSDVRRLTENGDVEHFPAWSPDGSRIAFLRGDRLLSPGSLGLYTMAADGSDERRILRDDHPAVWDPKGILPFPPVWSPDGERLAFIGWNPGASSELERLHAVGYLFTIRADGTELVGIGLTMSLPTWSPDSQELAYSTYSEDTTSVHVVRPDGSGKRIVWRGELGNNRFPVLRVAWSPSGTEIAFASEAVYVIHADGSGFRRLVKRAQGEAAFVEWSASGRHLAVFTTCEGVYGWHDYVINRQMAGYCANSDHASYLLVVQPDGAGLRILASGYQVLTSAWNAQQKADPVDPRVCSQGDVVPEPEANPGLVRDCETLLLVRDTLVGSGKPLPWDGRTPIDQWHGVGVGRDGEDEPIRVRSLRLPSYGLKGTLPPEQSRLTELQIVDLSGHGDGIGGNSLTGAIPPEWGQLSELTVLSLHSNLLSGPIPAELGGLNRLAHLGAFNNHLSGSIPPAWGPYLFELNLARNNLTGPIALDLRGLPQFSWLDLSDNQLTGEIPPALGGLPLLQYLDLSDNRLTGTVPPEFIGARDDLEANLLHNNLSGCIGAELPDVWTRASGLPRCNADKDNTPGQ